MVGLALDEAVHETALEILGPRAWLCPEQMVLRETDASKARAIARRNLAVYLGLPNYQKNLVWLGFSDRDFQDGGSDRVVDALVAWGDDGHDSMLRDRPVAEQRGNTRAGRVFPASAPASGRRAVSPSGYGGGRQGRLADRQDPSSDLTRLGYSRRGAKARRSAMTVVRRAPSRLGALARGF